MSDTVARVRPPPRSLHARPGYFLAAHIALFAIVLVGFSPTFFLRGAFGNVPLPTRLVVHGAILTLWFSVCVVQAWLVHRRQIPWHRRVGRAAACVAAAVLVSGLVVTSGMAATLTSPRDPRVIVVMGNCLSLLLFASFVSAGILLRARADVHKRLLLLASVAIIGPAFGRFPLWPIFAGGLDAAVLYGNGGVAVLLTSLVAHDVVTARRIHATTAIGVVAIVTKIAVAVMLGVSGVGFALLRRFLHGA